MSEQEQEHQVDQVDPEEVEAKQEGWVPKDQFKGPPEKWVDAATFNMRGKQIAGIVGKKLTATEARLAEQTAKLAEMSATLEAFKAHHEHTIDRQQKEYESQIRKLHAARAKADENGDLDGYKQADAELRDLESVKPPEVKRIEKKDSDTPPEIADFIKRNEWYTNDAELRIDAIAYSEKLERQQPTLTLAENLAKTEAAIKRLNPEKFTNPKRSQDQAVESGSIPPGGEGKKRDYHSLPASAKAACDMFVKQGIMTKDQYVKEYSW